MKLPTPLNVECCAFGAALEVFSASRFQTRTQTLLDTKETASPAKAVPLAQSSRCKKHLRTPSENRMSRVDAWKMVKRRARLAGIREELSPHSFRGAGITLYLESGGTLEKAQAIANHESARTTKLYDRTGDQISLDEIERIPAL
ncbi:MAG: tyrosine-type recombinase/integrase [Acidobacteria bacterium]|nr:tyrosine-type recombinase/integrase [Acidobacteriota bacterium]